MGTYTAFYMNRKRWVEKHGCMNGIDVIKEEMLEELERGIVRCAILNVWKLEELWVDVRDKGARYRSE
jgi:hypothetical protein